MQLSMFGPVKQAKAAPAVRQSALPFNAASAIESGRRGDPHPVWLDDVLVRLSGLRVTPDLVQIQTAWDRNLAPSQAAESIQSSAPTLHRKAIVQIA
jgi:hypothetical protein